MPRYSRIAPAWHAAGARSSIAVAIALLLLLIFAFVLLSLAFGCNTDGGTDAARDERSARELARGCNY